MSGFDSLGSVPYTQQKGGEGNQPSPNGNSNTQASTGTGQSGSSAEAAALDTVLGPSRSLMSDFSKFGQGISHSDYARAAATAWALVRALRQSNGNPFDFTNDQAGHAQDPQNHLTSLLAEGATEGQAMSSTLRDEFNSAQANDFDTAYMNARQQGQSDHDAANTADQYVGQQAQSRIDTATTTYQNQGLSHDQAYIYAYQEESINPSYRDDFDAMVQQNMQAGQSVQDACDHASDSLSEEYPDAHHIGDSTSLPPNLQTSIQNNFFNSIAAGNDAYQSESSFMHRPDIRNLPTAERSSISSYFSRLNTALSDASQGFDPGGMFSHILPPLPQSTRDSLSTAYTNAIHNGQSSAQAIRTAMASVAGQSTTVQAEAQTYLTIQSDDASSGSNSSGSSEELKH